MSDGYAFIYVDSVAETLAFYGEAFGFHTQFLHDTGHYGELAVGDRVIAFATPSLGFANLAVKIPCNISLESPTRPICLTVDDVASVVLRALAVGATLVDDVTAHAGDQTVARVRTPGGVVVELRSIPTH